MVVLGIVVLGNVVPGICHSIGMVVLGNDVPRIILLGMVVLLYTYRGSWRTVFEYLEN
jgi:hypothetical protein